MYKKHFENFAESSLQRWRCVDTFEKLKAESRDRKREGEKPAISTNA